MNTTQVTVNTLAMGKQESTLETTLSNFYGALFCKAEQLVLGQSPEELLEMNAFQIWDSPLGRTLASLIASMLGALVIPDCIALSKEKVALAARKSAVGIRTLLSNSVNIDDMLNGLPEERKAFYSASLQRAQEVGQANEVMTSFCAFLESVAGQSDGSEARISLSSEEERVVVFSLNMTWCYLTLVVIAASEQDDRAKMEGHHKPEFEAAVEYTMGEHGWGGDRNRAMKTAMEALGPTLNRVRRRKGWEIPGARYEGSDSWQEPHNDELEVMMMGIFEYFPSVMRRGLVNVLPDVKSGKLRNTFVLAAKNNLVDEIRKAKRQTGAAHGATLLSTEEADSMKRAQKHDVPGVKSASDINERSFELWREDENEKNRKDLILEKIHSLMDQANLTPRERLLALHYDEDDLKIASRLEEAFGKPVKPGAVRAARLRLRRKLRAVKK